MYGHASQCWYSYSYSFGLAQHPLSIHHQPFTTSKSLFENRWAQLGSEFIYSSSTSLHTYLFPSYRMLDDSWKLVHLSWWSAKHFPFSWFLEGTLHWTGQTSISAFLPHNSSSGSLRARNILHSDKILFLFVLDVLLEEVDPIPQSSIRWVHKILERVVLIQHKEQRWYAKHNSSPWEVPGESGEVNDLIYFITYSLKITYINNIFSSSQAHFIPSSYSTSFLKISSEVAEGSICLPSGQLLIALISLVHAFPLHRSSWFDYFAGLTSVFCTFYQLCFETLAPH